MEQCTLVIKDQVNVKFEGLNPIVRRKISETLKFFVPYARHTPSFKLGRWDGKVSFATVGGGTYLNLLDRVLPIVIDAGYDITIDDHRPVYDFHLPEITEDLLADRIWPMDHGMAPGEPIMLKDHQVRAINTYLGNLQSVQSISTSAGKTIITGALSMLVEPYGRTICIVPSKSLVEQTEEDYRNIGLDVGVFYGDRKEYGHQHTICTWQSLSVFAKKIKNKKGKVTEVDFNVSLDTADTDSGITLAQFLDGVICVMVDEVHSAKAKELSSFLMGPAAHIPIRWGLTGTIPKEDFEFLSILSALGPVVGEVRAEELQKLGILSNCHIHINQMNDDHVEFTSYPAAYEYLTTDKKRLEWIAEYCRNLDGNVLILVDRIECGETLSDLLDADFISGRIKTKDRKARYREVTDDSSLPFVATYGVAAVGINIPALHHVVLVEPGKAFVRVIQSIGRGLRRTKVKDWVDIHDICSTNKFSKRHLTIRKSDYKAAGYPFTVKKINYR